jgi:hypothetical protein
LREDARHEVGAAAGRVGDDQLDRLGRIGLGVHGIGRESGDQPEDKDENLELFHAHGILLAGISIIR